MEHRSSERHRTFAIVEIKNIIEPSVTGLVYNLSYDGAFILCTLPPKVGGVINIQPLIGSNNTMLLPISGIVIHRNEFGFGIMFCEQQYVTQHMVDRLSGSYTTLPLN